MSAQQAELPVEPDELVPTRASLLERLRLWSDEASWQEFFDTYWKLIYGTARAAGLSPTESEDVVQETIISVAKQMPGFAYRPTAAGGNFKRWLFKLITWRIHDQLRRRRRDQLLVPLEDLRQDDLVVSEIPDPISTRLEERWQTDWERNLLDAALERLKRTVEPKHYQIFHLHAIKEWSAPRIARHLRVSIPQVYIVKHRLATQIATILKALRSKYEAL